MGASLDITGNKYGRLTVQYLQPERKRKLKVWHCLCDCGNEIDVVQSSLTSGNTKSCGCLQKINGKKQSQKRTIDLTGKIFGKWTVIREDKTKIYGHKHWICKCQCGTIRSVDGNTLRNGKSTSCGCQKFSKGEEKIASLLKEANIPFISQWTSEKCIFPITACNAKFDFYVDNKYIIEFDGKQHFEYTNLGWDNEDNFKETKRRDAYKSKWCKENNIPLIRIPYTHINGIKLNDLKLETTNYLEE